MDMSVRLEELRRWREEAVAELAAAQAEALSSQQRVEGCRERLRLLDGLLTIEGAPEVTKLNNGRVGPPTDVPTGAALADALLEACEKIILDVGHPVHIRELHAALLKAGVAIPGRGTEANLLVRLHRSNGQFVRTGRGTYAPVSLGAAEVKPTRRRRVSPRSAT